MARGEARHPSDMMSLLSFLRFALAEWCGGSMRSFSASWAIKRPACEVENFVTFDIEEQVAFGMGDQHLVDNRGLVRAELHRKRQNRCESGLEIVGARCRNTENAC